MRFRALLLVLGLLGACGGAPGVDDLSQPPGDAPFTEAPPETPDAGTPPDAGAPPDAGTPDAGTPDAGTPDAGTPDAGTPPPPPPPQPQPGPVKLPPRWPQLQSSLPVWEIRVEPEHLQALDTHIKRREYRVPARFLADGQQFEVQVRYRGRHTRFFPKKPWQVRFKKGEFFQGTKRLELLAAYKDGGVLTEKLWFDVAARLGLKVSRARYVHLYVNGQYEGVYTELESVDKPFLEAHRLDGDADIYRCGMHDCELRPLPQMPYMEAWQKRTNEDQPWDRLWDFLERLNHTPPHAFRALLEKELALDDYLTWMALDTFINNYLQGDSRSYLIYDRERGQWFYAPWDLNNARSLYSRLHALRQGSKADHPLMPFTAYDAHAYDIADERRSFEGMETMKPTWSTLNTRILDDEVLRARYVARLRELLETELSEDVIGPRIDALHELVAPHLLPERGGSPLDGYISVEHARRSVEYLRRFVRERRAWLLSHLDRLEAHGQGPLVIDRVGREASGAFWVQLYNRGATPLSLGGLYLSGSTREPVQWRLPALTLAPGAVVTLRQGGSGAQGLGARLQEGRPEVALFGADGRQALDLLWLAPLAPGEAYGRQPRGAESFGPQGGP